MNTFLTVFNLLINKIEEKYKQENLPEIQVGDLIRLGLLIKEGNKERTQYFEGTVIGKKNGNLTSTITVRRVSQGIGVEKVFLVNSPKIKSINILRSSYVRRAKLYYLRELSGKRTRLKQKY